MSKFKCIKIGFHSESGDGFKNEIIGLLSKKYEVIEDYSDCDYFFATETIYRSYKSFEEVLKLNQATIRIFCCGEAIYSDLNLFDYVLQQNSHLKEDDRIIYRPYAGQLVGSCFEASVYELDKCKNKEAARDILASKTKFCNFIYSNPNAHEMRDQLFYALSNYKKVDALGSHLKNVEIADSRYDANWEKISIMLKKPYKFSIAAENAVFPGYTSEKLITSMLANTLPIYFGNPYVDELYNPASFINANKFLSLDELVNYVRYVDNNDDLYCEIMSQPWRTREQIENYDKHEKVFEELFFHIFDQELAVAKRRPAGTWPDLLYTNFFLSMNDSKRKESRRLDAIYKFLRRIMN